MDVITLDKFSDPDSPSHQLIQQLHQTTRAFAKTLNNDICDFGIYSSEWTILQLVKNNEALSQSTLAGYLNIEPAAISKTLSALEKKELIERRCLKDKREKYIFLRPKAQKLYDELEQAVRAHRQAALAGLSPEECGLLCRLLHQIYQNVLDKTRPST